MFALSATTKDREFAQHLTLRASDFSDEAVEMERVAAQPRRFEKASLPTPNFTVTPQRKHTITDYRQRLCPNAPFVRDRMTA
jgi:hypothetical protein